MKRAMFILRQVRSVIHYLAANDLHVAKTFKTINKMSDMASH